MEEAQQIKAPAKDQNDNAYILLGFKSTAQSTLGNQ